MLLVRSDDLLFVPALLGAALLAWGRVHGWRAAWRAAVVAGLALLAVMSPWMIRNLLAFGKPLVSHDAETAVTTFPGAAYMLWFAPGRVVPTVFTEPGVWGQERLAWLAANLERSLGVTHGLIVAGPVLLAATWRWLPGPVRALGVVTVLHAVTRIALVSLTPSIPTSATSRRSTWSWLVCWWPRRAGARYSGQAWSRRLGVGTVVVVLLACGWKAVVAVRATGSVLWPLAPREAVLAERYRRIGTALDALLPREALVASEDAEALTYYTGRPSVYLPLNAMYLPQVDWRPDMEAWLRALQPRALVAAPGFVRYWRMEAKVRAIPTPTDAIVLPDPAGPPASPGLRGALLPVALDLVAHGLVEELLAQPDRLGRHLDQLVLGDPLQRDLQPHVAGRREHDVLVAAGGADVGELLLLADVVRRGRPRGCARRRSCPRRPASPGLTKRLPRSWQ